MLDRHGERTPFLPPMTRPAAASTVDLRIDLDPRDEGVVYRLTIHRPRRLNVLDGALLAQLGAALARVAGDADARAVVLDGSGDKAWIGGADIEEMAGLDPASARAFIGRLHDLCANLRALPVPVLARIDGYCLGAGVEVAACCDVRVASERSRFGLPEVQVGIPTVIEGALLPRLVGAGRARDLVLTGRIIDAAEAHAWGLVETLAPAEALDAVLEERLAAILSAGPRAVRAQKALCRQWEELPLEAAVQAGIDAFARAFESDEPRVYMRRFIDRPRK